MKNMMNTNSVSVMTIPSANGISFGISIPDHMTDGMDEAQLSLILAQTMSEVVGDMYELATRKAQEAYKHGYEQGKQELPDDDDDDWREVWDDDDEDEDCKIGVALWHLLNDD